MLHAPKSAYEKSIEMYYMGVLSPKVQTYRVCLIDKIFHKKLKKNMRFSCC